MSKLPKDPKIRDWKKFNTGDCNGCWAGCCRLPLEASANDLIRLGIAEEAELSLSFKDVAKKLIKKGLVQKFFSKTQIFLIAQKKNKDCIFLDTETRRCTVYKIRPEVCRKFPKIGPRPGFCPKLSKSTF